MFSNGIHALYIPAGAYSEEMHLGHPDLQQKGEKNVHSAEKIKKKKWGKVLINLRRFFNLGVGK